MQRRIFLQTVGVAAAAAWLPVAKAAETVKVAVMIPQSGPAGMFGPASQASAELAAETINAAGGILGKPVTLLFGDAGLPPAQAAQTALRLWRGQGAQAVVGQHDSAVRGAIAGLLKGKIPYLYTPVYEGGGCEPGMYYIGETPAQQLAPVIPWIAAKHQPKKWYLIGNDYVWGRRTNAAAKDYIAPTGAQIVGEEYLPFSVDNFDASLARIRDSGADAVLVSLVGGASVTFNKAFASFGLDQQALRLGTLIEENTLAGIGVSSAQRLYASAGYFDGVKTPAAQAFASAYAERFGAQAPPMSGLAESTYEGLIALAAIANRAGSLEVAAMDAASDGAVYHGPRGEVHVSGRHVAQDIYLASVNAQGFDVVETFPRVAAGQDCKV